MKILLILLAIIITIIYMLVVIILVIIVGGVLGLFLKMFYSQIGPTCGFYSLIFAVNKVKKIAKKKTVRKVIKDSIQQELSYVGEIFNIDYFEKICHRHFKTITIKVRKIENQDELDSLIKDYYVIIPCNSKGTPHYVFIEGCTTDQKYLIRQGVYIKKSKRAKVKLFAKYSELEECHDYTWTSYFKKKNEKKMFLINLFCKIVNFISDPRLAKFLSKNEKEKKKMLLEKGKTPVDMFGKIVIIKR